MSHSPAFLAEISSQIKQAQEDLLAARSAGDEQDAVVALDRIADLREIQERALEAPQTGSINVVS